MYSCRYAVCSSRLLIWNALTTAFFDLSSAASAPRHLATIFTVEHLTQLQSCRSFPRATIDSVSMASAIKCAKVFLQRPIYSLNAVQLTPHVNSYCQVYKNFLLIKVSFRVRCLSPWCPNANRIFLFWHPYVPIHPSLLLFNATCPHNSESSKGQIVNINLPWVAKVYFISMWRFRCSMEEILERQLHIRGRVFATFSTIEKALAGRMVCRPG